jgi:hypothetical protein
MPLSGCSGDAVAQQPPPPPGTGSAGTGALVWKDATGKLLPIVGSPGAHDPLGEGEGVYFDDAGLVWAFKSLASSTTFTIEPFGSGFVYYGDPGCTNARYVQGSVLPRYVFAIGVPAAEATEFFALPDDLLPESFSIDSSTQIYGKLGMNRECIQWARDDPGRGGVKIAYRFERLIRVTKPSPTITLPIHPELVR